MNELKAHRFITTDELFPEANAGALYYDKSEADKAIADLEKKLDLYKRGFTEDDRINSYLYAELRHHKYKRCLAMAEICCEKKENCYNRALRKYSKDEADYLVRKSEFWQDWEFRWLKIAEKFKPN